MLPLVRAERAAAAAQRAAHDEEYAARAASVAAADAARDARRVQEAEIAAAERQTLQAQIDAEQVRFFAEHTTTHSACFADLSSIALFSKLTLEFLASSQMKGASERK